MWHCSIEVPPACYPWYPHNRTKILHRGSSSFPPHRVENLVLRRPIQGNPRQYWILDSMPWIPDSSLCTWDSGFLELYFWLQKPRFPIPQAKFSRIPDSTSKHFQDSGILIPLQGATCRPFNERRLLSGGASTAIRHWIFWEQHRRL